MNAMGAWWLDIKLALRMLVKYPGLALAGGVGIAVAVAIAAGGYSVIHGAFLVTALPFAEGERMVSLELFDRARSQPERRVMREFLAWRGGLRSIGELSAFRPLTPNLILPGEPPVSIPAAAISASGLRVTRVQPLLGRLLTEEDERAGAAPVAVVSESIWRRRLGADRAVVGRTIQLGSTVHTVVGVMPEGFAFPVNQRIWIPLAAAAAEPEPLSGPELLLFGRLGPGVPIERAQAELTAAGQRAAAADPEAYGRLQPRVLPYAYPFTGMHGSDDIAALQWMQGATTGLLVLVCLNVAVLMYARTAMRRGEIAVRTALGASRRRIITQLFLEAMVLSAGAAAAGVGIAAVALRLMEGATRQMAAELPFWISFRLSAGAVGWAASMSVAAAVIVGVLPAWRATRREASAGLRGGGPGGSGHRLGRTWTALIVAQAGLAVALLPTAVLSLWETLRAGLADPGFAAAEFLAAEAGGADAGRLGELVRRLEAEPGVAGVTFALAAPGEEPEARVEAEGGDAAGREVRFNRVEMGYFDAFGVPRRAGRGFTAADTGEGGAVIVNQALAQRLFGGEALGRRIRYLTADGAGRWYEIAGVVADFPAEASPGRAEAKVYHAVTVAGAAPLSLAIRMRGGIDAGAWAGRLREIAAAVDPDLPLRQVLRLDEVLRRDQWIRLAEGTVFGLVTVSVLLLSAAGIYALLSISVTQRRREAGIRLALGAGPGRVVASILARGLGQVAVGVGTGMAAAAALDRVIGHDPRHESAVVVLPVAGLLMMAAGGLGIYGPARRILRIEPAEALREQ